MFQDNHTRCKAKQSIIMIITSVSFPSFFYGVRIAYSFRFLCCFVCLRSVSCTQCCLCLWIVHYWLPLRFSRTFISTCSHIPVSYFYLHDLTVQILVPVINNAVKIITWYLTTITVFTVFRLLTDFVCLYNYEFWLSLCKIARSSVILLLPLFLYALRTYSASDLHVTCMLNERKDMCDRHRTLHLFSMET